MIKNWSSSAIKQILAPSNNNKKNTYREDSQSLILVNHDRTACFLFRFTLLIILVKILNLSIGYLLAFFELSKANINWLFVVFCGHIRFMNMLKNEEDDYDCWIVTFIVDGGCFEAMATLLTRQMTSKSNLYFYFIFYINF